MSKAITSFKPIYRLIPASLKCDFECGKLDVKCLYLISDLTYEVLKPDKHSKKHLPSDRTRDFLKGMLTDKYRRVVDLLIKKNIIQVRKNKEGKESYSTTHHHSKQYSLTKQFRDEIINDGVDGLLIKDHRQLKRINSFWEKTTANLIKKHPWVEKEVLGLQKLVFLTEEAEQYVSDVFRSQEYRDEDLTDEVYHSLFKCSNDIDNFLNSSSTPHISISHNRVFNNLVNANREFRQYIRTEKGDKLVELDMKSAQWIMLCKALVHKSQYNYSTNLIENLSNHIEEPVDLLSHTHNDVKAFISAVLFQDIYSELGILKRTDSYTMPSGYRHPDREAIKEESIERTLFNYFTYPKGDITEDEWEVRSIKSVLRATYPSVYDFILQCASEAKTKSRSSDLAILMQNYEGFFIHRVLQEALKGILAEDGYMIIHDAIYVPETAYEEVLKIADSVNEEFFGCKGMFKT